MQRIIFTENSNEYIAKSLGIGVVIGSITGLFLGKVIYFFAIGGVIGILLAIVIFYIQSKKKS